MSDSYQVKIRGEFTEDDGWQQPLLPTGAWWEAPLPSCPDCGGDLVWAEAGNVPGTRNCMGKPVACDDEGHRQYDPYRGCGSVFNAAAPGRTIRRERYY
jgi:hypothetical protein